VKFFFPDSQDQIDPSFDFELEENSPLRIRQRDDRYAHEVLKPSPYRGLLVSKAMIDRYGGAGRYSAQQRQRFYRVGVREFFRLESAMGPRMETMGDCGAFSYIDEVKPPYSVEEVVDFYDTVGFDAGLSVDHLIPIFDAESKDKGIAPKWRRRYDLTLDLAEEFLDVHATRRCSFEAIGVAQGWSPSSYANAVDRLQEIGYRRIAIGGLVPLKSPEILAVLKGVNPRLRPETKLHLLGVTRTELLPEFRHFGVSSFDSTSPFRQAFKDGRDNYYAPDESFLALRVPQVDANAKLQARIRAGEIDQAEAIELEQGALLALRAFDRGKASLETALSSLCAYDELHDGSKDRSDIYCEVLAAMPWKECECEICRTVGIDVILFRGTERNKRRGFHNLYVFSQRLRRARRRSPRKTLIAA
jgi:hypothetical protein